jgi:hypothetical protein
MHLHLQNLFLDPSIGSKFKFDMVVYKKFEDGWLQGTMTSYKDGVCSSP